VNYVVVFDIAHAGDKGLLFVAVGMFMALVGLASVAASRSLSSPPVQRFIGAAFGLAFLVAGPITAWTAIQSYVDARNYSQAQVVEGVVSYFKPEPLTGHGSPEVFCVKEQCFDYSEYTSVPGFNTTSHQGWPIKLGLAVRVTHIGNTIIKLEVAR
jgi:hypothetical protein